MSDLSLEQRIQRLEDLEAIRKLKALYCKYCDGDLKGKTHAAEKIVELFAQGCVTQTPFHGRIEGLEATLQHYKNCQSSPFVFHLVTNPIIEVDGDNASGEWWVLVASTSPKQTANWTAAVYEEVYVRTESGWKIKEMELKLGFVCPYETGWADPAAMTG